MRPGAGAATLVAALLAAAACDDDGDGNDTLRPVLEDIAPAVLAVEDELAGPQRYFEINATPQFVNLFVADPAGDAVTVYLYNDGELEPPTPLAPAEGPTFLAADATFDDQILAVVSEDLAEPDIVVFAINAGADGRPEYSATVQSERGGVLDVSLAASGAVLAVDPRG